MSDIEVDGKKIRAHEGQTLLDAALKAGLYIPHLCYHPDLPPFDAALPQEVCYRRNQVFQNDAGEDGSKGCGFCCVEVGGKEEPVLSCNTLAEEGMEVITSSPKLEAIRKEKLSGILRDHPHACLLCAQKEGCSLTQCSTNLPEEERCCPQFDFCELRKVAEHIGIPEDIGRYVPRNLPKEEDQPLFLRDYNLCVGCLRCVRACSEVAGAKALSFVVSRGSAIVGTKRPTLEESGCRFCGVCVEVCPTGAFRDKKIRPGKRKESLVPCVAACPLNMDIPSYVSSVGEGKYREASEIIREKGPLSSCLGYICHHPCEEACRRREFNSAVAICDVKRFALQADEIFSPVQPEKKTGKKIAVIGSGPAGLAASYFLAQKGHSVTVFESRSEAGGMLRWAVPEYRLPLEVLKKEVAAVESLGVEVVLDSGFGQGTFRDEFRKGCWDAVFLAPGAQKSKKIVLEGLAVGARGVYWGLEFLMKTKEGGKIELPSRVVVIGGGNVAFDAAMTALRLGASRVELACLEKREEIPAFYWEVQEAEREGVVVHPGWGPQRVFTNGAEVEGIELVKCTEVFDEKGCFNPSFDKSARMRIEAESVILAIGQELDSSGFLPELGLQFTEKGAIKIDPDSFETNVKGVFAGGDATLGPSSAVEAMASGKKAASSIDLYLGGKGLSEDFPSWVQREKGSPWFGLEEGFAKRERVPVPQLHLQERSGSFDLIHLGYSEEEARKEAGRCLGCHLRFRLSPSLLPPEKWIKFTSEEVSGVPATEGAFQLLDKEKNIVCIAGASNLRRSLEEKLLQYPDACFFSYEEDKMYTKRESELIQHYIQKHGHLPPGNEDIEDLF